MVLIIGRNLFKRMRLEDESSVVARHVSKAADTVAQYCTWISNCLYDRFIIVVVDCHNASLHSANASVPLLVPKSFFFSQ